MSAVDVLQQHQWGTGACTCGQMVCCHEDIAAHQLDALNAAGYAFVQLPEPDQDDEDGIGWCSDPLTDWGVYVPRDIPDGKVYDQTGGVTPEQARRIASWWLAAANAAEAQS